jgi:hypothetical protein
MLNSQKNRKSPREKIRGEAASVRQATRVGESREKFYGALNRGFTMHGALKRLNYATGEATGEASPVGEATRVGESFTCRSSY